LRLDKLNEPRIQTASIVFDILDEKKQVLFPLLLETLFLDTVYELLLTRVVCGVTFYESAVGGFSESMVQRVVVDNPVQIENALIHGIIIMFRYGLVGNTIMFGGGFALLGYTGYELYKLSENSTKMNEDLARDLF